MACKSGHDNAFVSIVPASIVYLNLELWYHSIITSFLHAWQRAILHV